MTYHGLLEYIRAAKALGASDQQITDRLRGAGWYQADIADALDLFMRMTTRIQGPIAGQPDVPRPSVWERLVPRSYDPHLFAIAALSFALGFLLYVLATR
jgi:hypothetical protein